MWRMNLHAFLVFLLSFLFNMNSAAQGVVEELSYRGDVWSISQLPRFDRPNSDTYVVLPIIRRASGKWEIGGSIKQDGYEQIFVDLVKRQIGPDARNTDRNGKTYYCKGSKNENRKKFRLQDLYISCLSSFFTADGAQKVTQAVLACAILACLGGYDSDWFPIFRPALFKEVLSSGLISELDEFFRGRQLTEVDSRVAFFRDKTAQFLTEVDQIDTEENDLEVLRQTEKLIVDLEAGYKLHLEDFEDANSRVNYSLGFSPKKSAVAKRTKPIFEEYETTLSKIISIKTALVSKIDQLNRARSAEQAKLLKERMRIINRIQSLLKENEYYAANIDGLLGPGTQAAIRSFFSDLGGQKVSGDMKKLLSEIETAILKPTGSCSKMPSDSPYVACLTLDL